MKPPGWIVRPILWFFTAALVTTMLHELAHALVAYSLDVPSTLYNYSVELDLTPAQAADLETRAIISVAGPTICLLLGIIAWLAYRRARDSAAALPLLYFALFGVGTFFGNLMSTAFVGDFSSAAVALQLPAGVRLAISLGGLAAVAAIHYWAGRELSAWIPADVGRAMGVIGIIVVPVLLGTALIIVVSQPMAGTTTGARIAESAFWLFAVAGAFLTKPDSRARRASRAIGWDDGAAMLIAILAVRVLARGVPFVP
jgi:hypothetical protein